MRVSVVFLFLFLSCVQLQRPDDQLVVGPMQLLDKSRVERSEPDVWTELRELRDMVVEQKVKLQSQIEELQKQNAALEERVVSTEVGVEAQREENANRPKVAFSFASGLKGHHGPHSTDNILVFHREITNIGNAFSKTTGVFTAPFRGVYYFRFNVLSEKGPHMLAVCLFKNEEKILDVSEFPKETFEYVVGGATLQLEKGDEVYLKLRGHSQIYDNSDNHCTFSGFLLFAM
ncbi:complement C1q-like protein 3 [Colossoma macropomum]|uniref:complement C1q-like protein 3 n=1 Tax=Colossoma macropomum TaxID=42526 RepID=UPI00186520F6|nr:complement C1q-like protein 3 [Colossoma macropomum]